MAARKRPECVECNRPTGRIHPILNIPVCSDCRRRVADKYEYISKTRAKETYRLKEADLLTLKVHIVDNPHYKVAAPT